MIPSLSTGLKKATSTISVKKPVSSLFHCGEMTEKSARFHVIASAYLSIFAGCIEAVLSMTAGHEEISMSLYGIALMAFVDIGGSLLVLSLWQCSGSVSERSVKSRITEMQYSIAIGYMMMFLGLFLIADSVKSLFEMDSPTEDDPLGTMVAVFGATCSISLAIYKYLVGKALDSPVVVADSISSLCAGLSSCAALIVVYIDDKIWWSDSTAGFAASLYTFYSGASTVYTSSAELVSLRTPIASINDSGSISSPSGLVKDIIVKPRSNSMSPYQINDIEESSANEKKGLQGLLNVFSANPKHQYRRVPKSEAEADDYQASF